MKRFRRLLIFHVHSPLREKGRLVAFWVNGHDGSRSKLDKFHKNAPIAPKLPSVDLPMIQLSVCYSESSKVYYNLVENYIVSSDKKNLLALTYVCLNLNCHFCAEDVFPSNGNGLAL